MNSRILKILLPIIFTFFLLYSGKATATDIPINLKRNESAKEFLREFSSITAESIYPNIYAALLSALSKLPENVFNKVTDRGHPLIFINTINTGIARYAHSKEFAFGADDAPALQNGFYLIVLSDELNNFNDVTAIEGILLHEIAHSYLDHLKMDKASCELEREANRLVIDWGYEEEYKQASEKFGAKKPGDSPCQDK